MYSCMDNAAPPFIPRHPSAERRWKPSVDNAPNCPRCDSTNTKFCYYNNYSLAQPRYFCKGCRRYWTKGGSLRNVPVGGGCRKNRRGKPIRLSAVSRGDALSSSTPSECDRQPLSSVRPDVLLDDPAGPPTNPSRTGGTDIDLAVLYARFLNQRPECHQGPIAPEFPFDEVLDLAAGAPPQELDCSQPAQAPNWAPPGDAPLSDFAFYFDPTSCDIDAIIGSNESLWQNCPTSHGQFWQSTSAQPAMEDPAAFPAPLSDANWCSTLFEAFNHDDLTAL